MSVENGGSAGGRVARGRYVVPPEDERPFAKQDHHVGWDLSMEEALKEFPPALYGKPIRMKRWVVIKENPGSVGEYITDLHDVGGA